ncbi:MAG: TonB-dependent receptor, partial [Flavobacteriaceae bacterium]
MKKIVLLLTLLVTTAGFAQKSISGVVTDTNGQPVPGASIIEKGTTNGTSSDFDGKYTLEVESDAATLVVSYLGFKTIEVSAGDSVSITLEEDALQLNDVVVTANKTAQNAQDVPLSVTVLGVKDLQKLGATEFVDYAVAIPNLSFGTQGAGSGVSLGRNTNQISLRGISGTNTTAFYLDDTPLPENIDPRILDISRVEVLRGPQGTLYGSNTLGGAIKVITSTPNSDKLSGTVATSIAAVSEGDIDYGINGIINIPLVQDKLAVRISGFYDFETGVLDTSTIPGVNILNGPNPLTSDITGAPIDIATDGCIGCFQEDEENIDDERNYGFMANLGFTPSKNATILAKVMRQSTRADGSNLRDGNVDNFQQIRGTNTEEYFDEDWTHYSLSGSFDFGKGSLQTSTSYFDQFYEEQEDEGSFLSTAILGFDGETNLDFWGGWIRANVDYTRFTHETRYLSKLDGKFNFVVGVFYSKEDIDHNSFSLKPGLISYLQAPFLEEIQWWNFDRVNDQREFSVFGEAYYQISDKFKLTAGLRYFDAEKEVDGLAQGGPVDYVETPEEGLFSESGVSPKFGLEYNVDDDNLIFANVSRGFRLGDVNATVPEQFCAAELEALGIDVPETFDSDFLWNYEVGYKGVLSDGRLIVNGTAFFNDWTDFRQQRFFESCGFGFSSNAGSARSIGFEIETQYKISKTLRMGLGFGIIDATIRESGVGLLAEPGDDILFSPSFTGNISLDYTKPLSTGKALVGRLDLQHASERTS